MLLSACLQLRLGQKPPQTHANHPIVPQKLAVKLPGVILQMRKRIGKGCGEFLQIKTPRQQSRTKGTNADGFEAAKAEIWSRGSAYHPLRPNYGCICLQQTQKAPRDSAAFAAPKKKEMEEHLELKNFGRVPPA